MLTATGSGGSSPYTFTWTENGVVIGTGASIEVDPAATNAVYCVTLSEACGSPTTNDCMNIVFPTAIVPTFVPDKTWSCEPGLFTFTNTHQTIRMKFNLYCLNSVTVMKKSL